LLKIYSEDFENEKLHIFFRKKKKIIFLKKLKTEDFFEDRKTQSSKLIFGQICRIFKDNLHGDLQKKIFKTIKNTVEFALEICLK
jgi:hypothetical protein